MPHLLRQLILPISSKMKTINKSFYHLKDSSGMTQLLVDHVQGQCWEQLSQIPVESTVLIEGVVVLRPPEAIKPVSHISKISLKAKLTLSIQGNTGAIDVDVQKVTLLNPAEKNMLFLPSNTHNLASLSYL